MSRSELHSSGTTKPTKGGLIAGVDADTHVNIDHATSTVINGTIDAARNVLVEARSNRDAFANADASASGLGTSSTSRAFIKIGNIEASTQVTFGGTADITGKTVTANSFVERTRAVAESRSTSNAVGADSDSEADVNTSGNAGVLVDVGAELTGHKTINLKSEYQDTDVYSHSYARCRCLGGDTDSDATAEFDTKAIVVGELSATLRTAGLNVTANQFVTRYDKRADRSGGFLDFGGANDDGGNFNGERQIFWESKVIMLGEPNPELEVDQGGVITKITNVIVQDQFGALYDDDDATPAPGLGTTIPGNILNVQNIIYDQGAQAHFLTNDPGNQDGETRPDSKIWGNAGVFEFQETWDHVLITNYSSKTLQTNIIDVVNTLNTPTIEMTADTIYDNGAGAFPSSLDPGSPGTTMDFDIKHTFPPTDVFIKNLDAAQTNSNIIINDYIENPIGHTLINNVRGDIVSGSDVPAEIIRTNWLELHAMDGNIGTETARRPISAEVIQYRSVDNVVHPIIVEVEASGHVVLDLTANRRSEAALGAAFTVPVAYIRAGDDIDLVINDSREGNVTGGAGLVNVDEYDPTTYPSRTGPDRDSGDYRTHFEPDAPDTNLDRILRAFGTDVNEIDSTYNIAQLKAGDDINVCHVTTTGVDLEEPRTCPTTTIVRSTRPTASSPTGRKFARRSRSEVKKAAP